jgi:hypothetical protein
VARCWHAVQVWPAAALEVHASGLGGGDARQWLQVWGGAERMSESGFDATAFPSSVLCMFPRVAAGTLVSLPLPLLSQFIPHCTRLSRLFHIALQLKSKLKGLQGMKAKGRLFMVKQGVIRT